MSELVCFGFGRTRNISSVALCFKQVLGLSVMLCGALPAAAQGSHQASPTNPAIAEYDGGTIYLQELEEFTRENPLSMRIPFARRAGDWRNQMAGELAKSTELTSRARQLGYHLDPAWLRSRDYFFNEYLAFAVLRDHLTNKMDVSLDAQRAVYETNKTDYWLSPTISLRQIRTRSQDKIASAAQALAQGKSFADVELEFSEVSPRYRGRVIGPFPMAESRTMIPPPDAIIQAAIATPEGATTGPITVEGFHYIVQPATHTPGRQQTLDEVAEKVEERLRTQQSATMVPALVDRIQRELGAVVDEELFQAGTSPNDQVATIGALKMLRKEYIDLNGTVRGPTVHIADLMPTRLKRFILPYMIGEWARINQYADRAETKRALQYYDIQHLASRMVFELGDKIVPPPSDEELKARFEKNIEEYRTAGKPEPRFEDYKEHIMDIMLQERDPELQRRVADAVLKKINFRPVPTPQSLNITALEALVAAGDRLPTDARLLEIGPARIPTDDEGKTPYTEIGRAPAWRISYAAPQGGVADVVIEGPAPLLQGADSYTSIGAYRKWAGIWQFDTDSLKRHGVDKALGDFMAKHDNLVRAAATVEFSYSKDDPTSPTDCLIVYSATPSTDGVTDGVSIRYSATDGEITKRRVGEPEGKCPTCPAPDLPAAAVVNPVSNVSTQTLTPNGKGDN